MNINKIIGILIFAELLFNASVGFLNPIFAIFMLQSIQGGTATIVGIAVAIMWFTKSVFRIPIGYFLDKIKGETDDFYSMIIGYAIYSFAHFAYLFAKFPWHIYTIQFFMGLAAAFAFTPWYGFFSRHIDKDHENFEWGMAISLGGFGLAGASLVTGIVVDTYGFAPIFIISGVISLVGTIFLFSIRKQIKVKMGKGKYPIKLKK